MVFLILSVLYVSFYILQRLMDGNFAHNYRCFKNFESGRKRIAKMAIDLSQLTIKVEYVIS